MANEAELMRQLVEEAMLARNMATSLGHTATAARSSGFFSSPSKTLTAATSAIPVRWSSVAAIRTEIKEKTVPSSTVPGLAVRSDLSGKDFWVATKLFENKAAEGGHRYKNRTVLV